MNIAVLDFETNGCASSSVLSASSIVFDEAGHIIDIFNRFYLPVEPFSHYLTRIHGLTPERLLAVRGALSAGYSPYFIEDWPDLAAFWDHWDIAGVVIHNARFDMAFLPEVVQNSTPCWCSMRGLTSLCALPKKKGSRGRGGFKWPRLSEAVDVLCSGPAALTPPEAVRCAEEKVADCQAHVSLADCFSLYRIVARILVHYPRLMRFKPLTLGFRTPPLPAGPLGINVSPRQDAFTRALLDLDQRLRGCLAVPSCKIIDETGGKDRTWAESWA
ncbi:MAG: hypothetical protein K5841_03025 [Fretibacterium sp.]|nr:hypothetical protein [Fretibacterium sp.]